MKAMEDSRFRVIPTILKPPKVTSQERLIFGPKNKIWNANAANTFEAAQVIEKGDELEKTTVQNVGRIPRSANDRNKISNPLKYFKQHRFDENVDLTGFFLGPITAYEIAWE